MNIFGCLYHSLLIYRLSAIIERTSLSVSAESRSQQLGHSPRQILQTLLSTTFFPMGIQVRTGDATMEREANDKTNIVAKENVLIEKFQNYLCCAREMVNRNQILLNSIGQLPIAFLVSDAFSLCQAALRRWQLPQDCLSSFRNECLNKTPTFHILANPDPVLHISYTSHHTLAFQLAMFDIFLFSLCEEHVISTDSGFGRIAACGSLKQRNIFSLSVDEKRSCLNDSQRFSLAVSGHHWSGI